MAGIMTPLILTMWPFLNLFANGGLSRSMVRLSNTAVSFSLTYSIDTYIWRVYFHRQVMLTTREHLSTHLCMKYFGIDNV